MMTTKRKIWIGLGVLFLLIQVIRIDKDNPTSDPTQDLFAIENAPKEIVDIMEIACYDCHSNKVKYPWYTNVAPISWWVKKHINDGRAQVNYSEWGALAQKKKNHKLEEGVEMVTVIKSMPLTPYWMMHWDAKLSPEQRKTLADWFVSIQK